MESERTQQEELNRGLKVFVEREKLTITEMIGQHAPFIPVKYEAFTERGS